MRPMLRQVKQFFSPAVVSLMILSLASTVHGECFNGSGRAGVIRNLERPWVFTVYLPDKATGGGHYRVKSFGVNLIGKIDCRGSKAYCQTDRGGVSFKKTGRGIEMKFSQDLSVEKRNESEDQQLPLAPVDSTPKAAQLFNLDNAHSDVCYDAFFKTSNYDEYAKAHGNEVRFPVGKGGPVPAAPVDQLGKSASAEPEQ